MRLILAALLSLALFTPVNAAECRWTYDDVFAQAVGQGAQIAQIKPEDMPQFEGMGTQITGKDYSKATRAFVANVDGVIILGIEMDGCLEPAINLMPLLQPSKQISGYDKSTGLTGA